MTIEEPREMRVADLVFDLQRVSVGSDEMLVIAIPGWHISTITRFHNFIRTIFQNSANAATRKMADRILIIPKECDVSRVKDAFSV